jgi:hypothetical protein
MVAATQVDTDTPNSSTTRLIRGLIEDAADRDVIWWFDDRTYSAGTIRVGVISVPAGWAAVTQDMINGEVSTVVCTSEAEAVLVATHRLADVERLLVSISNAHDDAVGV